jgi:hypothetical protein
MYYRNTLYSIIPSWVKILEKGGGGSGLESTAFLVKAVCAEAGVLKKLSYAGLAKLSRLSYSWQRFGLASADYRRPGVHESP